MGLISHCSIELIWHVLMMGLDSLPISPCLSITPSRPEGNGSPLNGRWRGGELSNSFQPLAADSIIKIIKNTGGGSEEERGKVQLQFLSSGHACWYSVPAGLFTLSRQCRQRRSSKDTTSSELHCRPN